MKIKSLYILILSFILITSCKKTDNDIIYRNETIKVNKINDYYEVDEYVKLKLDATYPGAISYKWTPTNETTAIIDFNPNYIYTEYSVNIVTLDTQLIFKVFISPVLNTLYCASAFSPNNDGINDKWKPFGSVSNLNYYLTIYNKENSIMFQTSNLNEGWDGKTNNEMQPFGVYYFFVKYETTTGKKHTKRGMFEMIDY